MTTFSTPDLPSSSNVLPPVLLSATPTGNADSMHIALNFSTAMAAGSGTITITDGAVETVIDRVTGLPATRVVGATDTHTLSASQLGIDGSHVTLNVANLLPGHSYSILMVAGVLVSSDHLAFGGVRSTSQVQFSTPAAPDTTAPTLVSIALDSTTLKAGATAGVTFTFSEAVQDLSAAAITTPHAIISHLAKADDGRTWTAQLTADGPNTSSGNAISVDMAKVHDLAGNAGSGSVASPMYAVDTVAPSVSALTLDGDTINAAHGIGFSVRFSEAVKALDAGAFSAPHASVTGLHSDDGGITWSGTLTAPAGVTSSGNQLAIDLSKVSDLAGNAGSGTTSAGTPYGVDTQGPSATILLGSTELKYGEPIGVTITLSDRLDALPDGALVAPNASISDLHTLDGGLTWVGTLSASGNAVSATNAVSLDLSALHDASGNAGTVSHSANYAVDNEVAAHVGAEIHILDWYGPSESDYVSANSQQTISGTLSGALQDGQHLELTIDGQTVTVTPDGTSWSYGEGRLHFNDGSYTVSARVIDDAGHSSAAVTQQFTIDTTPPLLVSSPGGATDIALDAALSFTFNEALHLPQEAIASFAFDDVADNIITYVQIGADNLSADGKTVTIGAGQLHLKPMTDYAVSLPDSLTDQAGNPVQAGGTGHVLFRTAALDTTPPSAESAVAEAAGGVHGIGTEIMIHVAFSEAVEVSTNWPALHLNNGGQAVYDHISGDRKTLFFKYTVGADGEADSANLGFADNKGLAGHVRDLAGNLLDDAHILYSSLSGSSGPIQIDAHAPAAPGAPALDAASDSGVSDHDGITKVTTPTFKGTAAEAGGTVEVYDGKTLFGTTTVNADKTWSFTVGSQPGYPVKLDDGTHTITAQEVDAAGNRSVASPALNVTIDTTAPTLTASRPSAKGGNWFDLGFSEKIVFAPNSAVDVLDVLNNPYAHFSWDVQTNWDIAADSHGVQSVLQLNLGTLNGVYHLQAASGAIEDLAGNAAIVGSFHPAPDS